MSDDPILRLAAHTLGASVFLLVLDALLGTQWDVPTGFWAVPPGMLTFLGTALAIKYRNGNGTGK